MHIYERKTFDIVYLLYFCKLILCDLTLLCTSFFKFFYNYMNIYLFLDNTMFKIFCHKKSIYILYIRSIYTIYIIYLFIHITRITFALINCISNIIIYIIYKKLMYFFFFCILDWIVTQ